MEKTSSISLDLVAESIAVNSTAFSSLDPDTKKVSFIGSKTEAALLGFIARLDYDYADIRQSKEVYKLYPFASARKSMSTLIKTARPNGDSCVRLHTKGASEIVLGMCGRFMKADGSVGEMTKSETERFAGKIEEFAHEGLRTISVAFRDISEEDIAELDLAMPPNDDMCLLAILGIEDPTRQGVPEAVAACQKAGIFVRMVTGDNKTTARKIASRCGIYTRGGIVMEGPQFRQLSDEALDEIVPRLQVLARSSPLDKQILVRKLRELGEVVAVTGDGTNDGPALRAANVGFAMGIAGTEVAKEASSIILMDDNFTSIVKAVSWGRCVNDSVRKFLQFQLTVNVAAVLTAIISALVSEQDKSILSAIQLLWVNLIMDSFAALALATDLPTPELMDRKPEPLKSSLITPSMWKMVFGQALYQVAAMMIMIFLGPRFFSLDMTAQQGQRQLATFVFNSFVFMQLFNEVNCRRLGRKFNIFKGIFQNWIFLGIWVGTVLAQILIVFFGGAAFNTTPISRSLWAASVGLGFVSIPLGFLIRLLPDWESQEPERVYMSRERLQWQAAAQEIRRGLSVFHALRRAHNNPTIS
jgi:Ca2+-transporting ATPase